MGHGILDRLFIEVLFAEGNEAFKQSFLWAFEKDEENGRWRWGTLGCCIELVVFVFSRPFIHKGEVVRGGERSESVRLMRVL